MTEIQTGYQKRNHGMSRRDFLGLIAMLTGCSKPQEISAEARTVGNESKLEKKLEVDEIVYDIASKINEAYKLGTTGQNYYLAHDLFNYAVLMSEYESRKLKRQDNKKPLYMALEIQARMLHSLVLLNYSSINVVGRDSYHRGNERIDLEGIAKPIDPWVVHAENKVLNYLKALENYEKVLRIKEKAKQSGIELPARLTETQVGVKLPEGGRVTEDVNVYAKMEYVLEKLLQDNKIFTRVPEKYVSLLNILLPNKKSQVENIIKAYETSRLLPPSRNH